MRPAPPFGGAGPEPRFENGLGTAAPREKGGSFRL